MPSVSYINKTYWGSFYIIFSSILVCYDKKFSILCSLWFLYFLIFPFLPYKNKYIFCFCSCINKRKAWTFKEFTVFHNCILFYLKRFSSIFVVCRLKISVLSALSGKYSISKSLVCKKIEQYSSRTSLVCHINWVQKYAPLLFWAVGCPVLLLYRTLYFKPKIFLIPQFWG